MSRSAEESSDVELMTKPLVIFEMDKGEVKLELEREKAPITVANFLEYVNDGFYDGTVFHRVIDSFMIQGGGFTKELEEKKTRPPIKNEADNGFKNRVGTIAMARTFNPNSATAQFFINVNDNDFLNYQEQGTPGYAVFGKVVEGLDVIMKISKLETQMKHGFPNFPVDPVIIEKAYVVSSGEEVEK